MINPEFVTLGTRCTAATILNLTGTRKNAYPFDWVDLHIENVLKLVKAPHADREELAAYIDNYFNEVRSQRHPDNTWFPHDFIATDNPEQQLIEIKEKYLRRFNRLFDLFHSGSDIVFLSVFPSYTFQEWNQKIYSQLIEYLKHLVKGNVFFMTINLHGSNNGNKECENLVIPFNGDWPTFDADIISQLKENHITKQFFK